ncbi:MAG: PQQ-dependent sugar dehydrogenase [Alphaproteobacteria bacterium]|nr:PQQ-dependent sugar dehydrogenase [Alphaproteobacteria bacterium]
MISRRKFLRSASAGLVAVSAARLKTATPARAQNRVRFKIEILQDNLSSPWALGLLPDGGALLSERSGRLFLLDTPAAPRKQRISGLPKINAGGQGGLLDVQPTPNFADTGEIVFAAAVGDGGRVGTEVFRARLAGARLAEVERIFAAEPKSRGGRHFGCRLRFTRDGDLVFGLGERGDPPRARDPDDDAGKIHRIRLDGAPASGNPFADGDGAGRATVVASGTRNSQGLEVHPRTGAVWFHEHGPRGGDEVNLLRVGADYGWPLTTHGRAYSGGSIGVGPEAAGIESPLWVWVPSIAPSGMDFWFGEPFGESLFAGALAGRLLARLTLSGESVVSEERYLEDWGRRIREVRTEYDGAGVPRSLLILTDESRDAVLARLAPML